MRKKTIISGLVFLIIFGTAFTIGMNAAAEESENPLILQEVSWTDVREYLQTCDMIIIPIGATEQHGPHLPLGTDYYEALGMSKLISARTGVMVAPVIWSGCSAYHSGFPGTLSLKPETLEQVLFETAEMLAAAGFRRIMFFNFHGGNKLAERGAVDRINRTTEAVAVSIGYGGEIQEKRIDPIAPNDAHAGVDETSVMLCLQPDLVKMERAEKPEMTFSPLMQKIKKLLPEFPELRVVLSALTAVPAETNKGGASHELSDNGIWTGGDPREANIEFGQKYIDNKVENAVRFIKAWKKVY